MSPVLLRHATQKPPTGVIRIDRGDSLASGLLFAAMPGLASHHDIVSGAEGVLDGGAWDGTTPLGQAATVAGSGNNTVQWTVPAFTLQAQTNTVAGWIRFDSVTGFFPPIWSLLQTTTTATGTDNSDVYWGFDNPPLTNSRYYWFNSNVVIANFFQVGWHHYAISTRPSDGLSSFYMDGKLIGSGTQGTSGSALLNKVRLGNTGGGGQMFLGACPVFYLWQRPLSQSEVMRLYSEPFALFQTRPIQRWFAAPRPPWTEDDGVTTIGLYDHIFEQPASDLNYIQSPPSPTGSVYVARLAAVQQPQSGTITLHTRASQDNTNNQVVYSVQLRQGSNVVQSFYHQLSTSWAQFDDIVSNAITDWTTRFDVAMGMSTPFVFDTFTGADNTFLTAHTPDIGSGWVNPANADAYITSNAVDHDTNNTTQNVNTTTAPSLSYTVSAQINVNGRFGDQITLLSRIQGTPITDAFYASFSDFSTGSLDLGDVEGGGFNSLASSAIPGYPYTGIITFSLTVDGTAISCAINGQTLLSATSSRNVNPGTTGLMHWYGGHGLFTVDNFMAVAKTTT